MLYEQFFKTTLDEDIGVIKIVFLKSIQVKQEAVVLLS